MNIFKAIASFFKSRSSEPSDYDDDNHYASFSDLEASRKELRYQLAEAADYISGTAPKDDEEAALIVERSRKLLGFNFSRHNPSNRTDQ